MSKELKLHIAWKAGYFQVYGDQCAAWFRSFGWQVTCSPDLRDAVGADVLIVIGINFYPVVPPGGRCLRIGIHTEQLPLPEDTDWSLRRNCARLRSLHRYYDLIVEWSPANYCKFPRAIEAVLLPYGCAPLPVLPDRQPDYDVLFLGNPEGTGGRRRRLLDLLKARFNVCPRHHAWGAEKDDLVARSAICLNLHQFDSLSYESPRFFELLSAGVCLVSEPVLDSFPFVAGRDYRVFSSSHDLPVLIAELLADSNARRRLALHGYAVAQKFLFEYQFGLLERELRRRLGCRHSELQRLSRWSLARAMSAKIACIDWLAATRRRLLRGF